MSEEIGSEKTLGKVTVRTRRMFHAPYGENGPEGPAIVETVQGDFLYMNGLWVDNREHLEYIPEQHRAKALAWFDRRHGEGAQSAEPMEATSSEAEGSMLENVLGQLMAELKDLRADVNRLKGVGIVEEEVPKQVKNAKKAKEEPSVLKEAGVE